VTERRPLLLELALLRGPAFAELLPLAVQNGPLLREAREIVPPRIGCSESLEDRIDADGEAGEPGDVGQRLGVEVRSEELHEARIQCGELSDERAHLLDLDLDLGLRRLTLGGGGSHDAASNRNVSDLGEHVHAD